MTLRHGSSGREPAEHKGDSEFKHKYHQKKKINKILKHSQVVREKKRKDTKY
jgi:hypothetical protein